MRSMLGVVIRVYVANVFALETNSERHATSHVYLDIDTLLELCVTAMTTCDGVVLVAIHKIQMKAKLSANHV